MNEKNINISKNNGMFYKDLFQNNLEIMLLFDPETLQIKDCYISACKFYGYSYDEILNLKISDINLFTEEQVRNEMQLAKNEKRNYFNFKHRLANGQIRDVDVKSSTINLDGKELLFSIIKDTTDYKIYDQKLRIENSNLERIVSERTYDLEKEIYRTIFEQVPFGIALADSLNGQVSEVNQEFADILRISKEECLNIDWISITHPDDVQEDFENFKKMNAGEINSYTMQKRYICPDNSIVWVNIKIVPIVNGYFKSTRNLCMIEDITDIRNAYISLKESELRFREVFENSTDCIFIVEEGINGNFYYKGINPTLEKIKGQKNTETFGKYVHEVFTHEDAESVNGNFRNCIESGNIVSYEETLNFSTGVKHFSTKLIPVRNDKGHIYRIIGIAKDITTQKQAENVIKYKYESQKLLLDISANFANVIFEDIDNLINLTLKQIGEFDKADRSYVFFFSEGGSLMSNTHEWCAEGIQPEKTNLQNISSESLPWWMNKLRNFETIIIPRVSEMPAEAHNEKEILQSQSIKSVIVIPIIFENMLIGYLGFDSVKNEKNWTEDTSNMLKLIANIFGNSIHRKNKILAMLNQTVNALSTSVEIRDPYTSGHQKRVANIAIKIAEAMGLSEFQIQGISMASLLHDIGKVVVPSEILNKPGKLSEIEFSLIKIHSQAGYDILKDIEFPWQVKEIVLQHHERINGSGYPNGLTGDKLLLEAKIIAVADAIEAMVSHRPYRAALSIDESFEELIKNKGILFDSEVVDCCIKVFNEKGFELLYRTYL